MKVLDIGCGKKKYKGKSRDKIIGIDRIFLKGVDVVNDIEVGLPFRDDAFDLITCSHILEHVNNFIYVMEEIHRVLKPNGMIRIRVPYFSHASAFADITHRKFFTFRTFEFFDENNFWNYYTKARFQTLKRELIFSKETLSFLNPLVNPIVNRFPKAYERFFAHIIPCSELYFELKAKK